LSYQSDFTGTEVDLRIFNAKTILNLSQPEPLVGDGTYKSPTLYVEEVPGYTENFSYTAGSLTYTGTEDIQVKVQSTITLTTASAGNLITMTTGVNGTPNLAYEIENKMTTANDEKELTNQGDHTLTTGDTLDFFAKATGDFSLKKAVWTVDKIN